MTAKARRKLRTKANCRPRSQASRRAIRFSKAWSISNSRLRLSRHARLTDSSPPTIRRKICTRNHILRRSTVPSRPERSAGARGAGHRAAHCRCARLCRRVRGRNCSRTCDGALLVNEIAPRVHNSGHWTLEACAISQFEQHIRAVAGWPLGDPARHSDAAMENIIGAEAVDWQALASRPGALHLYGKPEIRPGRKMGHITTLSPKTLR